MGFRFIEEDFKRYVKKGEHGGRHIWDDLLERLRAEFGVEFAVAPYEGRKDWLRTMWFAPKKKELRPSWIDQAQFYLIRDLDREGKEGRLSYGLMIEHPYPPANPSVKIDPDLDGERLMQRLKEDTFLRQLDQLVQEQGFQLGGHIWATGEHRSFTNAAGMRDFLNTFSPNQERSVNVRKTLSKKDAIAYGETIAEHIMAVYSATRTVWEAVIPPAVREFINSGGQVEPPALSPPLPPPTTNNKADSLCAHLSTQGLRFTPHQIATYLTALQTKGLVILSGLSGTGKTRLAQAVAGMLPSPASGSNCCFLAVRPDWRDSKSLLGYFNPLTRTYEWTDFLRFLVQADAAYREHGEHAAPHIVLLDEMNLARVEYYLADLLSVLESGRDEKGYTREPLRFTCPDDIEDKSKLPPSEIHLPPNLYVVGTVNVDETTHAFSPKVLDRAFTIEFGNVDFDGYPPAVSPGETPGLDSETKEALRRAFTRDGHFAIVDKAAIRAFTEKHPEVGRRLQALNAALAPHGLGFGYRVFDEIVAFLDNALAAPWRDGFGSNDGEVLGAALDAAVRMKVLPKFHGPTGKLAGPLLAALAWAENPDAPDEDRIKALREQWEKGEGMGTSTFAYPETGEKAERMLRDLRATGLASFA